MNVSISEQRIEKAWDAFVAAVCLFSTLVVVIHGAAVLHNEGVISLAVMAQADVPPTDQLLLVIGVWGAILSYTVYLMAKEVREYNEQ